MLTANDYYGANTVCWTPNKYLQFDPTISGTDPVDIEHFGAPLVHPTMGETITSYRKLAKDVATKETWTTGFGKEFGNLAQGSDNTGTPGMDAIRTMNLEQIKKYSGSDVRESGRGFQTAEGRSKLCEDHSGRQFNRLARQINHKNS